MKYMQLFSFKSTCYRGWLAIQTWARMLQYIWFRNTYIFSIGTFHLLSAGRGSGRTQGCLKKYKGSSGGSTKINFHLGGGSTKVFDSWMEFRPLPLPPILVINERSFRHCGILKNHITFNCQSYYIVSFSFTHFHSHEIIHIFWTLFLN